MYYILYTIYYLLRAIYNIICNIYHTTGHPSCLRSRQLLVNTIYHMMNHVVLNTSEYNTILYTI